MDREAVAAALVSGIVAFLLLLAVALGWGS